MIKIFKTQGQRAKKRAQRRKAIRAAVAAHRDALEKRGLVRVETILDAVVADELRARAKAADLTLRAYVARILTDATRG